jgi:Glycosyl transferase family 2
MPRISVLVPTHEHAATLPYAVRSVQRQSVDDLEILVCGDGVSDDIRAVVAELQRTDPRIRFFDLPKGPNIGENNRDYVLRHAEGEIVCVQNDDDLWLPGHIEALERSLQDADFVGAMQVNVGTDDKVRGYYFDLERPEFVKPWLDWKPNYFGSWASNGFGPIFVGFRLDAYKRLPERWSTTPAGLPSDQTMWHKFLRQQWCRARFIRWPIALHFASSDRTGWTPEQRAEELRRWTQIIESPDYAMRIWRDLLPDLGDRLLSQVVQGPLLEIVGAHEKATLRAKAEAEAFISRIRELEAELAATRSAAAAQMADFQAVFDATRDASTARIRELEAEVMAAQHHGQARRRIRAMSSWALRQTAGRLRRAAAWMRHLRSSRL